MIRFHKIPRLFRNWYSQITWSIPSEQSIYLTFDDGPDPNVTDWVLNALKEYNAKATFFCTGRRVAKHPKMVERIIADGHGIGNHSYNHLNGWKTKNSAYIEDVQKGDLALKQVGVETRLFRPPYGKVKSKQMELLKDRKLVNWSLAAYDFDSKVNVDKVMSIFRKAKAGDILLFHDSEKAFKNLKFMLPNLLSFYQAKGYKFEVIP
ncbi:MAG: polysaccharide deacetylase family protein [Ekhidna sp.]